MGTSGEASACREAPVSSVVRLAEGYPASRFHAGSQSHEHVHSSLQVHRISAFLSSGQGEAMEVRIGQSTVPAQGSQDMLLILEPEFKVLR